MYKIVIITLLICIKVAVKAQKDSTPLAQYLLTKQVPGFKLLLLDSSTYFYKYQLKKNTPTVIIYFNPDCGHCKIEAKNLVDSIRFVQNVQFVFASYGKFNELKEFDKLYKLSKQKNIRVGRDEKYYIPVFYKVRYTPFVAVYDANGNLLSAFEDGASVKQLAELINATAKIVEN